MTRELHHIGAKSRVSSLLIDDLNHFFENIENTP